MGSIAHRGQEKVLKLSTEISFSNKKMLVFSCYKTTVGSETKVYSHSQNPCSLGLMPIPKTTPNSLLITLSASNPLQSGDNSNCNTSQNSHPVTLYIVNTNSREQFHSSQVRQALQKHKLSSGKL